MVLVMAKRELSSTLKNLKVIRPSSGARFLPVLLIVFSLERCIEFLVLPFPFL